MYFKIKVFSLYLPVGLKKYLFEYRSILFGLILKEENEQKEQFKITNIEMANRMIWLHQEIISQLRSILKLEKPELDLQN